MVREFDAPNVGSEFNLFQWSCKGKTIIPRRRTRDLRSNDAEIIEPPITFGCIGLNYPNLFLRNRSEFPTTESELKLMAAAAQMGVMRPTAANGTQRTL